MEEKEVGTEAINILHDLPYVLITICHRIHELASKSIKNASCK